MNSKSRKIISLLLALVLMLPFVTVDARAEGEEQVTVDVSLNTQFRDKDGKYSRIPNAVSKAVNTETGEEFIFKMDAEGNIPYLKLPSGTYKLSIVSVPEEFSEGKRLDLSYIETVTIEETSRAKGWKVIVKEIPTVDVSLNTQFRDKDGKYSRIPNAVSKAVNTETGEEFIFKMDAEGNIPYLKLPSGTYKLSIVSVPEEFSEGKRLDLSYTETVTIEETSRAKGWKVTVKEIPTIDVSLNTQFRDKDGNYSRIPNAVSKAVNTETGEEFIFKMDAEGNIPHLQLPSGKYKLSIVSVPEEFSEGKRLDLSYTETVTIEETSRAKGWKVTVKEIPTIDVSLNTQFLDKDGKYSRIPNAVSKAVNTETGEEFIFKMDAEGNIPHLQLPSGTYKLSIVSVPEEFSEGKRLDLSYTETVTIEETSRAKGWKVTVKELPADEEPEVEKWQFGARLSFRNLSGKNYESLEKTDKPWKSVTGAVIKITNSETNKVYEFVTNESGSHQLVETGKYTIELVSVPEELKDKFEWPEAKEIEIKGSSFFGFNVVEKIPTIDVSLNTQYMDLDRNFSKISNAVSKAVNTETGEEFIFKMDAEGNIPHLQLPAGTYKLSIVSVPEEFAEGKKLDLSATSTEVVLDTDKAHGWTITVKELPADEEPEVEMYQIGLEVRDLENKKTKDVTVEVLDKDGKVVKGDFNEMLQYLTDDLDLGIYTIKLSNLPENTKAVLNENTFNKAKETENKNEFTLEVSEENLITASSNRVWGAFKLVEELPEDEEPETPEPKLIKLTFDPNGGSWSDDSTDNKYVEAKEGDVITILEAPTREGYKFLYWKGSEYQPGDKYEVKGPHTFVAQWEEVETPEVPENPETPEVPEKPETPEVPEKPETPKVPEKPETPKVPEKPGKVNPRTGDAGVMMTSVVTVLSAAAYVFTRKLKKED